LTLVNVPLYPEIVFRRWEMAGNEQFNGQLQAELERVKRESFAEGYQATDEEALGIVLSRFFQWDGLSLLRTAQYALEDANFHTESGAVAEMADAVEAL
jgi:hypothetical protein